MFQQSSSFIPPFKNSIAEIMQMNSMASKFLFLDASQSTSYPGSGQVWSDISGNGRHFLLGNNSSVNSTDPTFNGSAGGNSRNEYFSFDGGDRFSFQSGANDTFINGLHKSTVTFTCFAWVYLPTLPTNGSSYGIFGTTGGSASAIGLHFDVFDTGSYAACRIIISNGSGTNLLDAQTGVASGSLNNRWNFFGFTLIPTNYAMICNGTQTGAGINLSGASASNATRVIQVGTVGFGVNPLPNGSRLANLCLFDFTQTSTLQAFFQSSRTKFGV